MIFVDTNVFYNVLFNTKFTSSARRFIDQHQELATSPTVINELILVAVRNLCEERYSTRNHSSFKKFITNNGYEPFRKDLNAIFEFFEDSDICLMTSNEEVSDWREIMQRYRLLPFDALIAATCLSNGIKSIATFDRDFMRVDTLKVIDLNE